MRTSEEIIAFYKQTKDPVGFGFAQALLLEYMTREEILRAEGESSDSKALADHKPVARDKATVKEHMKEYMVFAWGKVADHRGVVITVMKFIAYLYLMGDDELRTFAEDKTNWKFFGAPILNRISVKYGFPIPEDHGVQRMVEGKPCWDECDEGCI